MKYQMKVADRVSWVTLLRLLLTFLGSHWASVVNAQSEQAGLEVTEEDKAAIVKSVLERKLKFQDSPERVRAILEQRLKQQGMPGADRTVKPSAENIDPNSVPEIAGIRFILLQREEIQEKSEDGVTYLRFDKFEVEGSKVIVGLSERRRNGADISVMGTVYEYRKESDQWIGRATGGYGT